MKKKLSMLLAGTMALSILLTSCGSPSQGSAQSSGSGSGAQAVEDRTLTIGLAADPQTMDPQALLSTGDHLCCREYVQQAPPPG